jgi:hypothetical protein
MKIEITNGVETPVTKFFCSSPETDAELHAIKAVCKDEYMLDTMAEFARKLERERDEARKHCESIVDKANELIARWDQPSWKDTAPTARFINALRFAVRAYERNLK